MIDFVIGNGHSSDTDSLNMKEGAPLLFRSDGKSRHLPASAVVHKLSAVSLVGFEIFNLVSIAGTMDMIH